MVDWLNFMVDWLNNMVDWLKTWLIGVKRDNSNDYLVVLFPRTICVK